MSDSPLLEIRDLWVTYWQRSGLTLRRRPFHAVKGATLSIAPGETLGLVGESGSGKSSIANAVLGLVPAASGSIRFGDAELSAMKTRYPAAARRQIQAVFQDPFSSLNPSMTVGDIVAEPLRVHTGMSREERRARAAELLKLVSLSEEHLGRHPHQFSGGQRQRVAIAAALALQPRLIVLDEPASALDVSTQNQIINLLYERRDALGIAYLLIAHDLALVHHISDRIAVMYLGHIVEQGPAGRVYSAPAHPYTRALLEAVPLLDPARQRARRAARKAAPAVEAPRDAVSGCPYSNRCPSVMARCRSAMPAAFPVEGGGTASCFLAEDRGRARPAGEPASLAS
ncbi:oligopeptide transport system ATP-binding protein [Tistlia consotensis]|uniref:Oligopeptide transport system ATP-binding protein n=1 Tax=Tistlia consotensis USBA 355 TaxID=560819 RepID=A0A1Y6CGN1_9PROT|nr:oligopeptide/dipeptide ABC transporter ATP-binding protein [Tistlia consotensis]SMF52170.1 oligopeptide transport system ATP-binding protein [Tistlia consotensis USBA 355]SNR83229.1 oligopeptide transport system ATP-binding protein [Tistlia consotensis]